MQNTLRALRLVSRTTARRMVSTTKARPAPTKFSTAASAAVALLATTAVSSILLTPGLAHAEPAEAPLQTLIARIQSLEENLKNRLMAHSPSEYKNVEVIDSPAVRMLFTVIRNKNTANPECKNVLFPQTFQCVASFYFSLYLLALF